MPELPEVETLVRALQPAIGTALARVEVLDELLSLDPTPLVGSAIRSIRRTGKYIILDLGNVGDLVVHLRMSGRLKMERCIGEDRYTRLILHLDSGEAIRFVNPRRLGTVQHWPQRFDKPLGVDAIDSEFTPALLKQIVAASRSPIKNVLMNQLLIAGVGNIYAAEALWHASLSPKREARSLTEREINTLHRAIVVVLQQAIENMGTTLGSSVSDYRPSEAECGSFQNELAVYGRSELPCKRCGTTIQQITQAGRTTCFCPACQT